MRCADASAGPTLQLAGHCCVLLQGVAEAQLCALLRGALCQQRLLKSLWVLQAQ